MEVIVGTYEEMVLGYKLIKDGESFTLEQSFTNHNHTKSIRCLAASSHRFLATGSIDETINLLNLKRRVEHGSLTEQEGGITALEFIKKSHLLSGSEDGTICVWKTRSWQLLKTLRGHKKGITDLSVHPSGKMALSLSNDMTLMTWNLVKGRSAYTINLKTVGNIVQWSPSGNLYAVAINNKVDMYSVDVAGVIHSIDFGKTVLAIAFITDDYIAVGGEGGKVEIHATEKEALSCEFQAHQNRVKGLCCLPYSDDDDKRWLVSGSSDGLIKIWNLWIKKLGEKPLLVAEADTSCRITCLTVVPESKTKVEVKIEEQVDDETKIENTEEQDSEVEAIPEKRTVKDSPEPKRKKRKRVVINV